jgi:hypothetical protein
VSASRKGSRGRFVSNTPELFWSLVQPGPLCWIWLGPRSKSGYGVFRFEGRTWRAHRLARVFSGLPLEPTDVLCHHCDTPLCVRADHCFVGTHADNRRDCVEKGRQAKGDSHWARVSPERVPRGEANGGGGKLDATKVREIRSMLLSGASKNAVARRFGVSSTMIGFIVTGKQWAHV